MATTFRCQHCGQQTAVNLRLKAPQQYCRQIDCQRARKAAWIKRKRATDRDYQLAQQDYARDWRKGRPADAYMRQYRQDHPVYVTHNRTRQRLRNQQRRAKVQSPKIVKVDASTHDQCGTYIMTILPEKIVKIDALVVQLQAYDGDNATFSWTHP